MLATVKIDSPNSAESNFNIIAHQVIYSDVPSSLNFSHWLLQTIRLPPVSFLFLEYQSSSPDYAKIRGLLTLFALAVLGPVRSVAHICLSWQLSQLPILLPFNDRPMALVLVVLLSFSFLYC